LKSYELTNKEIKTKVSLKSNVKNRKQHAQSESSSSDSEFAAPSQRTNSNKADFMVNCWQSNEDSQCTMIQNRNKAQYVQSKN
jgi:invasion protein IalB